MNVPLINYDPMDSYQKHIDAQFIDEDEIFTDETCPRCGYPIVIEAGLEVCYKCGWSKDEEETGYYDE